MKRTSALALASLLTLGLAACQREAPAPDAAEVLAGRAGPAQTVESSAAELARGNLLAVVQTAVPPAQFERMRAEWKARRAETPEPEEAQQFAEMMQRFTQRDAEQVLYAELEPQLAKMEQEMAAQMPLMVGMGRGFAMQTIQQSEQLTAEQKKQAGETIDAIASWLQTARFFDRDLARQAVTRVVATARELNLQTLEQVHALEFEQALAKGGIALRGAFDVLGIYGLNIDQSLKSVRAETISEADDAARVRVNYTLFQQPLSFETEMVKLDGRWYGREAMLELDRDALDQADQGHHAHD